MRVGRAHGVTVRACSHDMCVQVLCARERVNVCARVCVCVCMGVNVRVLVCGWPTLSACVHVASMLAARARAFLRKAQFKREKKSRVSSREHARVACAWSCIGRSGLA